MAAGEELLLAHPEGAVALPAALMIAGGRAVFLTGTALFKWAVFERVSWWQLGGVVLLCGLIAVRGAFTPLSIAAAAAAVLFAIAVHDTVAARRYRQGLEHARSAAA
jgi:low temperature requirement protein LtrA